MFSSGTIVAGVFANESSEGRTKENGIEGEQISRASTPSSMCPTCN